MVSPADRSRTGYSSRRATKRPAPGRPKPPLLQEPYRRTLRAPLENRSTVQPEGLLNLEKQSIPRAGVPMPPRECYIPGAAVASSMTRERDVPQAVSALEPTRQVDSQPPLPRETGPARESERGRRGIYTLGLARLAIAITWVCLTRINGLT